MPRIDIRREFIMPMAQIRRRFLTGLSLAGAARLLPAPAIAGEERLETASVRLMRTPSICHAPQFVAEDLLRREGFTDIRYIEAASSAEINEAVASGKVDFNIHFAPQWVSVIDGGDPVTVVHVGCFELFGNARHPQHSRSQRQDCRRDGIGVERTSVRFGHGRPYRARSSL
jgi:NitT/TauT family transport system substrate-binding protein